MAFRRRQIITRTSAFKDDDDDDDPTSASSSSSSLAAQAIRASRSDSSYSPRSPQGPTYDYRSLKTTNDQAGGFWNVLARTAKSVLDEDISPRQYARPNQMAYNSTYFTNDQHYHSRQSSERSRPVENPTLRKGLDALTSSFNQFSGTTGNALEEGRSMVDKKTSNILQESPSKQIRRKGTSPKERIQASGVRKSGQEPLINSAQPRGQSNQTQLKASRDVAMATTAKAKLLLRELKTTKADLAFSKQRCAQIEEENKMLRAAYDTGDHPADDDMIRLQLETLLAEKARLAHENSVISRENRFLREVVEFHQLTMQDFLYLDEGIEEVTEVYPAPAVSRRPSVSPTRLRSTTPEKSPSKNSAVSNKSSHGPLQLQAVAEVVENEAPPDSTSPVSSPETAKEKPNSLSA
ncbi:Developmental and secondary metabolism regulator veA like [Heracleum sosnowskyi]|uniref:Developmental and secondary metabolism regulator veA like n=1 Tax=Heracleum sosnowskyi TaxID=360622 RepID=A0AAD8M108_9APIA|nr:Developmental and secondary metabolism regulator veA like [Heracleum sosnowskyi]